jgi:hypothetical protein
MDLVLSHLIAAKGQGGNVPEATDEAKDDLVQRIRKTPYAGNVHFLDGERLDSFVGGRQSVR